MSAEYEDFKNPGRMLFYWTVGGDDLDERLADLLRRGWTPDRAEPELVLFEGVEHLRYQLWRSGAAGR